jgi:hypothetical protein
MKCILCYSNGLPIKVLSNELMLKLSNFFFLIRILQKVINLGKFIVDSNNGEIYFEISTPLYFDEKIIELS